MSAFEDADDFDAVWGTGVKTTAIVVGIGVAATVGAAVGSCAGKAFAAIN